MTQTVPGTTLNTVKGDLDLLVVHNLPMTDKLKSLSKLPYPTPQPH